MSLKLYQLTNPNGMTVLIANWGARIASIRYPVQGNPTEMLATPAKPESIVNDEFYLGATCGPVCNRISDAKFELNGETYHLAKNDGDNCLHSGTSNFSLQFWELQTSSASELTLTLRSADRQWGFPGNVEARVSYSLTDNNELAIRYSVSTDKATPINLTNHAYFNLGEENCKGLRLQLNASRYLEKLMSGIPTGKLLEVANSDFDFRDKVQVGQRLAQTDNPELIEMAGYDHCFVIDDSVANSPKALPAAILDSVQQGVRMELLTDQPAVQFYTGRYLSGELVPYAGLCLEAQDYTNAINQPDFPDTVVRPEQVYQRYIGYRFSTISQ